MIAALLSTKDIPTDAIGSAELGQFVEFASHAELLDAAFGKVPRGLRGALRRSGSDPHPPQFYGTLFRLLSTKEKDHIAKVVYGLENIDILRLRIAERLPRSICFANLVKIIASPRMASDIARLVDLLVGRGIDLSALVGALQRVESSDQLSDLWDRWSFKATFPANPLPPSTCYTPVNCAADLSRLASRFRNCAKRYVAQALDGESAFAEFIDSDLSAVIHLRRYTDGWALEGIFGQDNGRVDPELSGKALDFLASHDIRPRPRPDEASGEWQVLRRLTRSHLFDLMP